MRPISEVVTTTLGRLRGQRLEGLTVFRGVPFAEPPLGPLRFRAPEAKRQWRGERAALGFGAPCPQGAIVAAGLPAPSEDCLTLNLWAPTAEATEPRPVMVFFHGGGFTSGASGLPMYDGAALALRGDVVVVSCNYRLGALGFVDLSALSPERFDSNLGLRDQLACLRFVRDNAEVFGGDPGRVTVFGQSAGAMCAVSLMASEAARGLFRSVIAQSGAGHHTAVREESGPLSMQFLEALGLGQRSIERVREVRVEAILEAQEAVQRRWITLGRAGRPMPTASMTLVPAIDGELLEAHPFDALARGRAAELPLLLGSTAEEWNFWVFLTDPAKHSLDEYALSKVIEKRLPGRGAEAIELYRRRLQAARGGQAPEPWRIFSVIESERAFGRPARLLADSRDGTGASTFLYRFEYRGPLFDGELGACHTMDVPFVLGSVERDFGRDFTGGGSDAIALSGAMIDAWAAFARSGDPSSEGLGTWSTWQPGGDGEPKVIGRADGSEALVQVDAGLDAFWAAVT
ncbi:MAG: carboxylesterase family protein [Myxococcales bacterium]|nr:carboxylesterase family protein [Myxococcales bacterium]